jgi:N-acetyl-anhydromuramyl-L-alanine amidase AmpD
LSALTALAIGVPAAQTPASRSADEPKIVDKPIQFDPERIRLTHEYMHTHYGLDQNDITIKPQAIVLHYTAINSFISTWNYFNRTRIEPERAQLQRESELNVSAQFLVDRDGTIYRLMPEDWMARHCIGLNHVAIGVENVGDGKDFPLTDAQVYANASLVRYLSQKFTITYLLGHHEYRRMEKTPLFHESVAGYRTGKSDPGDDFMRRVRAKVADLHLQSPPAP